MNMTSIYSEHEKHSPSQYTRKCIDGKITGCGNCIGYCQYEGHPGFLTAKLRQEHNCLGKECFYYIPKPNKEKVLKSDKREKEILAISEKFFSRYEGLKIIRVREDGMSSWVLSYVALFSDAEYISTMEQMVNKIGCEIRLERLNYDLDTCLKIIYA